MQFKVFENCSNLLLLVQRHKPFHILLVKRGASSLPKKIQTFKIGLHSPEPSINHPCRNQVDFRDGVAAILSILSQNCHFLMAIYRKNRAQFLSSLAA